MSEIAIENIFRRKYKELTDDQKKLVDDIKYQADVFYSLINQANSRETSLAKTKLEECVMWAVKGVTA
jgi:hypothetical protein